MEETLSKREQRSQDDAKAFADLDSDTCQLCLAHGEDKRSLWVQCFYDVKEAVPEMLDLDMVPSVSQDLKDFHYIRICKACRSGFLEHLQQWANERRLRRSIPKDHDGNDDEMKPGHNVPVRHFGAIKMMTPDEYRQQYGREPIQLKEE